MCSGRQHLKLQQQLLDGSLGFAGGVMLAASYFSLLAPAVELAEASPTYGERWSWLPATFGFLLGAAFVYAGDKYGPVESLSSYMAVDNTARHKKNDAEDHGAAAEAVTNRGEKDWQLRRRKPDIEASSHSDDESITHVPSALDRKLQFHRVILLVFAVTVHNFPEGLAVGVGFGAVGTSPAATLQSAWALAIGIGLQNFPEGFAGAFVLTVQNSTVLCRGMLAQRQLCRQSVRS